MARNLLSQTLAFRPCSPIKPPTSPLHFLRSSPLLLSFRFGSSRSQRRQSQPQTVEMDVDPESEAEVAGLQRRLEDAIHGLIVRRSAPEWLPFLPGSSYWVPQPSFRLVGRLAVDPLSEEEVLSLTSVRGWPSSAYFIEGDIDF